MAPAPFLAALRGALRPRSEADTLEARSPTPLGSALGPLAEAGRLLARDDGNNANDPSSGGFDPHDVNNIGFFFLFALIGVGIIITGIWFFFWAKNGGFFFEERDWDDYKTTVLRRRGPNGTLLTGATPSTNLGGGSVYKDVEDDGHTVVTEGTALSGITAGPSEPGEREKRRKKQDRKEQERQRKKQQRQQEKENEDRRHVGTNGVEDENAEKTARSQLRSYRHERPARVGGLNKESDGSAWDGSTNPTQSETSATATTTLLSAQETTPTNTPTKPASSGIRKVYSAADREQRDSSDRRRDTERLRAEARRLRDEGRAARRDFSYQRTGNADSAASESLLEGSSVGGSSLGGTGSDLGTKSYHHPMPELREQRKAEREERRARRGGYRRGKGDDDGL